MRVRGAAYGPGCTKSDATSSSTASSRSAAENLWLDTHRFASLFHTS